MPGKREPLIQWDDVIRIFHAELRRRGVDLAVAAGWEPVLIQTRISRLERGLSSSPERQLTDIIEWCVRHQFRPARLLAEELSGSVYRRRRRKLLEQLFDDLQNDRMRDPETGAPIKQIVCWMYDRFTRDPEEGGMWLREMLTRGVDLHETHWDGEPLPLYQIQNELRRSWVNASHEVENTRLRLMDELLRKAERGLPTFGMKEMFGHTAIIDRATGTTIGYRADPQIKLVTERLAKMFIEGASKYSLVCWLNENGYRNAAGNKWTMKNLERFLRSPRLAGLVRLRTDPRRIHDKTYEGDLYPIELMREEDDVPDDAFDPPIEPLIPFQLWAELQDALDDRYTPRGPYRRYFASGFLRCEACGSGLTGSQHSYRCPKRHLDGILRIRPKGSVVAADGKKHPSINMRALDRFLEELIFAVVELEPEIDEAEIADELIALRGRLDDELVELQVDVQNLNHLLLNRTIGRTEFDERLAEIENRRRELKQRRRELTGYGRADELPRGVTLRDLWPQMPMETRREWLDVVFEEIVLSLAPNFGSLDLAARLTFMFKNGYAPPEDELTRLLTAIEEKVYAETRRRRGSRRRGVVVDELLLEMLEERLTITQMRTRLIAHPDPAISDHYWTLQSVALCLRRICGEKGIPYNPARPNRWHLPPETRQMMLDLYADLGGWAVSCFTKVAGFRARLAWGSGVSGTGRGGRRGGVGRRAIGVAGRC